MKRKDRKIIKKLAKETLKKKWYPIQKGFNLISFADDCAFCREAGKRALDANICDICYIPEMKVDICMIMNKYNTREVIELLEQLAEFGEIKIV